MPGKYYVYVPFDTAGDLGPGIDTWMRNAHAMARARSVFRNLEIEHIQAEMAGKKGEQQELELKLADYKDREKKDKGGDVGLDQRKVPIRINHYDADTKLAVLSGLQPYDYTLYVIGHCTMGSQVIFNESPRTSKTQQITATELFKRMKTDGLPQTAFNIKLLACYGASDWQQSPSFLSQFVDLLKGYLPRAYIRGYTEPVYLSEFYADQDKATKKAAHLPDGTINNIKVKQGSLSNTRRNLAIGLDQWPKCSVPKCDRPARFKCRSCKDTFYCSKTHQQEDFNRHYPNRCLD